MKKIKLLTSYLDDPADSIIEVDEEKAEELVRLGRAIYLNKMMSPKKKIKYEIK